MPTTTTTPPTVEQVFEMTAADRYISVRQAYSEMPPIPLSVLEAYMCEHQCLECTGVAWCNCEACSCRRLKECAEQDTTA